jgi:hypothetical protein
MALNLNQIKCAVAMIGRANCTGAEAPAVNDLLQALAEEHKRLEQAEVIIPDGNDTDTD